MSKRLTRAALVAAAAAASFAVPAPSIFGQPAPAPSIGAALPSRDTAKFNVDSGRLALKGYDPVSYFPEGGGTPLKGVPDHEADHRGVKYRFASHENHQRFLADPARYEPAYGGWCALAVAMNTTADIEPDAYRIEKGRLFVFYNKPKRDQYFKDGAALTARADARWKQVSGEDAPARRIPTASDPRDVQHYHLDKKGLAVRGYDIVAYFPEGGGKPAKGSDKITLQFRGVTYRFADEQNKAAFLADPDRYEPAYGGWCASAMADGGRKVEIDPKNYKITEGRLFLFYTDLLTDAQNYWKKDEPKNTAAADGYWQKLTGETPRPS